MRACLYALIAAACILSTNWIFGQDLPSPAAATPRPPSSDQPSTSTATVILAVDRVSEKSRGRIYVYGSVKGQGPQEIPADESYTVSKAIIKAGGFGDFANKRKVKLTRKTGKEFTVDLKRVIEEGKTEEDVELQPDDQIYVPQRLINM